MKIGIPTESYDKCMHTHFSPIWPLGSDMEAIKGHNFYVYYNIQMLAAFVLMHLDGQNDR